MSDSLQGEQKERALRDSALLRTLVDNISAMVAYWDRSLHCRFANEAYRTWFGVAPESLVGKHIQELLGSLYELNQPYIEGVLRGEPQEFEREIANPRGGPSRHGLAHYIPDLVDGVVQGFFVLVTDVSAVKRAEHALRESEERFRLTLDEAPIGMALVAPDGRFTRVNRALCDIVGYSPAELTGLTFQAITHPDDLDVDLALAGQLERGEIPRYKLAKRYIRKDRTVVDVMLSGSAVRAPDGTLIHYIAQIEDITEQRRSEYEQRFLVEVGPTLAGTLDYDETLSAVAHLVVRELADICILEIIDEDGTVRRVKVTSRDPAKALVCKALSEVSVDRTRPYLLYESLVHKRSALLSRPSEAELAALGQDPQHRRALAAANIHSLVLVPLFAHARHLGAMALISSNEGHVYGPADLRLAEKVAAHAGLAIDNARLYRAARHATAARDEMLSIVAHDLGNPLHAILMQAELLRQGPCREELNTRKAVEMIDRAASRMNRLIADLLDVARIEAGKLPVELERLDAAELVLEAVEAQRPLARRAPVELVVEVAPRLPTLLADRHRLLQVFQNLLGNALKFTPAGGKVEITAVVKNGDVMFGVRDSGCGISAEDLPRLFDRFWQARRSARHGAGLGLPIAKGIIDAHHGRIWVTSTPGVGTAFSFTIPADRRDATAPRQQAL